MAVAARSQTWIWGRSFDGIMGSNPADVMDACLLCSLSFVR